jgi:hypothetical protein
MWKFVIKTGNIYDPKGVKVWTGYSGGNGGKNPEAVNNPLMVSVKMTGPLPPGIYTFGTPVLKSHLGPFAIPLIPDAKNVMFGRGDFYVHGDRADKKFSASEGCIIAAMFARQEMWTRAFDGRVDHQIHVVAEE